MKLKENDLQPGDGVLLDHYESTVRGCPPNTRGKESEVNKFCGGTIAADHGSTKIWVEHQVSLLAGETLQSKHKIEREFHSHGLTVKQYHSDNGVFRYSAFMQDLKLQG